MAGLPRFADLPITPGAPPHSSWGVWGEGDRLGCWNLVDDEAARRGAASVRTGRTYRLDAPHDPALARFMGRVPFEHRVEPIMGVAWDDVIDSFNTQASTQWDGFGHFGSPHGHYNGLGRDDHGVDHWAARSFATRGVLADVARWRERQGRPFDAAGGEMLPVDELLATLQDQGSAVLPGDVLLIRFGWMDWWRNRGSESSSAASAASAPAASAASTSAGSVPALVQPGLEPSLRTVEVLWDLHVAAVACDPALDPIPGKWGTLASPPTPEQSADPAFAFGLSLHWVLPYLGLSIGEFFDLDALADDCAAAGDWHCLFTTAPMHIPSGVATPANAVAVR